MNRSSLLLLWVLALLLLLHCTCRVSASSQSAEDAVGTAEAAGAFDLATLREQVRKLHPAAFNACDEQLALYDLFAVTGDGAWAKDEGKPGPHGCRPCLVDGVSCNQDGHVVSLTLTSRGVVGYLPTSLNLLQHLEVLEVSDNKLTKRFPVLHNPRLRLISAGNNKLLGELDVFQHLPQLARLDIRNNVFRGSIPSWLLDRCEALVLSNNRLSGVLPDNLLSTQVHRHMLLLDVSGNAFSGKMPPFSTKYPSRTFFFAEDVGEPGRSTDATMMDFIRQERYIPMMHRVDLRDGQVHQHHFTKLVASNFAVVNVTGLVPDQVYRVQAVAETAALDLLLRRDGLPRYRVFDVSEASSWYSSAPFVDYLVPEGTDSVYMAVMNLNRNYNTSVAVSVWPLDNDKLVPCPAHHYCPFASYPPSQMIQEFAWLPSLAIRHALVFEFVVGFFPALFLWYSSSCNTVLGTADSAWPLVLTAAVVIEVAAFVYGSLYVSTARRMGAFGALAMFAVMLLPQPQPPPETERLRALSGDKHAGAVLREISDDEDDGSAPLDPDDDWDDGPWEESTKESKKDR